MAVIEIRERGPEITQRQRYSHYFALIFGVIGLLIGVNLRDGALFATTQFVDARAGVRAFYPQNWLIDTNSTEYVFRVRDVTQPGYKTMMQISMRPVGPQTTVRNVIEQTSLGRMQSLAEYSLFSVDPFVLEDQPEAFAVAYAFAAAETDPFLESLPSVVRGLDIVTIKRGQAIIITFRSDVRSYEQNLPIFEQFLADLEF